VPLRPPRNLRAYCGLCVSPIQRRIRRNAARRFQRQQGCLVCRTWAAGSSRPFRCPLCLPIDAPQGMPVIFAFGPEGVMVETAP
jgi:hypothetical protein